MKHNQIKKRITVLFMAFLMVCLFLVSENISAKDNFISGYIQTIYNQNNGIGSNEVNCLYQSKSGYIWVGTEDGLYRSNGTEFSSINLWDTERTDLYSINSIMQDSKGRMWIGTDNYGLFYIEDGTNYHLQDEYYDGIKKIYDVCETKDGEIYVATANGLYTSEEDKDGNMKLNLVSDSSEFKKAYYEIEIYGDNLWAVDGTSDIYIFEKGKLKYTINTKDLVGENINHIKCIDGYMYALSEGKDLIEYKSRSNYSMLTTNIESLNGVMKDNEGRLWVCADNGLGYFDSGDIFNRVYDCKIDNYLSDMIQDYENNYWFASNRMGVLLLSRSKFVDYNLQVGMNDPIVNCVYKKGANTYVGTDDGILVYDSNNEIVENDLTELLRGISVRDIDSSGGIIWISTYRKYGLIKYDPDAEEEKRIQSISNLPGSSVNRTMELADKSIAVATDKGVAIVDNDGKIKRIVGEENKDLICNATCLYQDDNGLLYIGTDGEGIYTFNLKSGELKHYTVNDGLSSDIISAIAEGDEGLWIGTDDGLSFYNESFRQISNIEASNIIYDVLINDDKVFLLSSKGVLSTTEDRLLNNDENIGRYFDVNDGLSKSINTVSHSYIDKNGLLYICCNTGVLTLDTKKVPYNLIKPKIAVTSISIDGKKYEFDDLSDGVLVKSDTNRLNIDFAVFSFNNRNNLRVEYYLDGFDDEPIVISGNETMQAVYTNLDGGVYTFVIKAYNGDGTPCENIVSFIIEKEKSFFEKKVARFVILSIIIFLVITLIIGSFYIRKAILKKNIELEKLSKEHEEAIKTSGVKNDYLANMSNEIKTPINSMITKAGELMHIMTDEKSKSIVKDIYEAGANILFKVDDIILFAQIEAGKIEVLNAPYSVSSMMYELSESVMDTMQDGNVKFFVEIGEDVVDNVIGDKDKIKDILARLIYNAIKFTKIGSITFSVDSYAYIDKEHSDEVNLVFTVSDTGIGIQEDRLDSLFDVSNIVDNVKNTNHSGNGLGLAIAKGYSDIIGAEIEVESAYGSGSTFTLSVNQKVSDKATSANMGSKIEGVLSKEDADKLWLPEVNALIVEDDDISREVFEKTIEKFEMKIDVASTGMNAIDMVMNSDYDVVFMDLSLPVMNGIDVMKEIRDLSDDKFSVLPIIALDADAIEGDKTSLIEAGFTESLLKPVDVRKVAAVLKDCLPQSKIKEKSNNIKVYIDGSRYKDGLLQLKEHIDVEAAIEKIGGSIEVFNKLIVAYYNQFNDITPELFSKIDKDIRGFKTKIHALRTASINIGAFSLSHEASKIEAAINIGNKDYVKNSLDDFTDIIDDVMLDLEVYIAFVDELAGVSDEEFAQKNIINDENNIEELIDIGSLQNIKDALITKDYGLIIPIVEEIKSKNYHSEDREFLTVFIEAIDANDDAIIEELINTYISLKM